MALARTYLSVDGQILSEHRSGEAKSRDYVHDALGNVVAVFQDDWEVALATYDTSGEFLTNFNMSGYKFAWNGSHGYRSTGLEWSSHYVRARHYAFMDQAWTTRDPLWPREMPYGYVNGMAMSRVDPSGMKIHSNWGGSCRNYKLNSYCDQLKDFLKNGNFKNLAKCLRTTDVELLKSIISEMAALCDEKSKKKVCVTCGPKPAGWPDACKHCGSNVEGYTAVSMIIPGQNADGSLQKDDAIARSLPLEESPGGGAGCSGRDSDERICLDQLIKVYGNSMSDCDAVISICTKSDSKDNKWLFYHELSHAVGYSHSYRSPRNDFAYRLECCLCKHMNIEPTLGSEPGGLPSRDCFEICKGTGYKE